MPRIQGLNTTLSKIHGYGVFTTRRFLRGDILVYGDGVLYREEDDFNDEYALILPGYELDQKGNEGPPLYFDLTCQTRWINHSCDPNTEVDTSWDELTQSAVAWWVALRDIATGEELSYDYAFSAHLAMPCACGSKICRGLIVDENEIGQVSQDLACQITPCFRRLLAASTHG